MYGRSAEFDNAVRNGGHRFSALRVIDPESRDILLASDSSDADALVGLVDGSVIMDVTAQTRRRFTATLIDPDGSWVPKDPFDPLSTTAGYYVEVITGFIGSEFAGGIEYHDVGWFLVGEPEFNETKEGIRISLAGPDLTDVVRGNRIEGGYLIRKDHNPITEAQNVIDDSFPFGVGFNGLSAGSVPWLTPWLTYEDNTDRWDIVDQLLTAVGAECHLDVFAGFSFNVIPDPLNAEVAFEYAEGPMSSLRGIQGASRRSDVYNGVTAIGENTLGISAAHATVWDDDSASPTYYRGRFGKRLKKLSPNPAIRLNAQAEEAAKADLRKSKRLAIAHTVSAFPHPCHEGYDVVHLERERLGINSNYLLERYELPLSSKAQGSMTLRKVIG